VIDLGEFYALMIMIPLMFFFAFLLIKYKFCCLSVGFISDKKTVEGVEEK